MPQVLTAVVVSHTEQWIHNYTQKHHFFLLKQNFVCLLLVSVVGVFKNMEVAKKYMKI